MIGNPKCKKCGGNTAKGWVDYVTKYYCRNEECELYDKPVNN